MTTNRTASLDDTVRAVPSDEEIIQANIAHVLANPQRLYEHPTGQLDAVAALELGIHERGITIRQHQAFQDRVSNKWSVDVISRLEREVHLIEQMIYELRALGIDTELPMTLQLRREREHPIPSFGDLFTSALKTLSLGSLPESVTTLLNPETPAPGITTGKIRAELRHVARLHGADLNVTAGWGIAGNRGIVMPAKGRITPRGELALDIWLNETTCWESVPQAAWNYTLGGYPVLKNWLSYREGKLLGRPLTTDEARDFTHHARRIAALIQLQPALDQNYQAVREATHEWRH